MDLSLSKQVTVLSANHKKHIDGFNADHVDVMYVSLKKLRMTSNTVQESARTVHTNTLCGKNPEFF